MAAFDSTIRPYTITHANTQGAHGRTHNRCSFRLAEPQPIRQPQRLAFCVAVGIPNDKPIGGAVEQSQRGALSGACRATEREAHAHAHWSSQHATHARANDKPQHAADSCANDQPHHAANTRPNPVTNDAPDSRPNDAAPDAAPHEYAHIEPVDGQPGGGHGGGAGAAAGSRGMADSSTKPCYRDEQRPASGSHAIAHEHEGPNNKPERGCHGHAVVASFWGAGVVCAFLEPDWRSQRAAHAGASYC